MSLKKVIHIIPYDGTGGVETAARSMDKKFQSGINFKIHYIYKKYPDKFTLIQKINPFTYLHCAFLIFRQKPDLLIVSLWRSCIVAILVKVFLRRTKIALFLHYPENVHVLDMILTNIMSYFSNELWADSKATFKTRISNKINANKKIISFVTHRLTPISQENMNNNFIFWGRLHQQKGLNRAIDIFRKIRLISQESKFFIIGPDGGEEEKLKNFIYDLKLQDSIIFLGEMSFSEIKDFAKNASFYLQSSQLEGMGMSVVEAMQLGLIPVVTPVGEINNYCTNQYNSILIDKDDFFLEELNQLIFNQNDRLRIRNNAIESWATKEIYSDSVYTAAINLLN